MKKITAILISFFFLASCKNDKPKNINLKFSYIPEIVSNNLKQQFSHDLEFVNSRKTNRGIEITIDKYVTGIPYYGKARIVNDTLYLEYWTNIDEMDIPSVIIPSRFKYEIIDIPYKSIKFNFLGNKYPKKEN